MNLGEIRERLSRTFKPFALRTSNGRQHAIRREIDVHVEGRIIVVLERGMAVRLDPLHVVALLDLRPTGLESEELADSVLA